MKKPNTTSSNPKQSLASTSSVRIVQAASQKNVSVSEITQLAEADPAFALRLLALVNSPAFSLCSKVSDIKHAGSLLGIRALRNIALSLVVTDLTPVGSEGTLLLSNALRRAITARLLAKASNSQPADSGFAVGLLLEAGLLSWSRTAPEAAYEIARSPAAHRLLREDASGHTPHPQVGAQIAREYGLPDEMVLAIEHHHDELPPKEPLARIAWAAEHVAAIFEGGALDALRTKATAAVAELGMSSQQLESILLQLPSLVTETAMAFERPVGPQFDLQKLRDDANARLVEMNQHYEELVQTLKKVLREKSELTRRLQIANESLATLAATDPLTGLPNRRAMEEALIRDLARAARDDTALSVVMVDIDHFKRFNDEHGHLAGDETLHCVAELLKSCLREGDLAVRFGGEEFVLVLANADEDNAFTVAERVRQTLAGTSIDISGQMLKITASFGVATTRPHRRSETLVQLFERADTALYSAKEAGRNRVMLASPAAIAAE